MAATAMEADAPAPCVIGIALKVEKFAKHISSRLIELAAQQGIALKQLDVERPLEEQGPFHAILQKIRTPGVRAAAGTCVAPSPLHQLVQRSRCNASLSRLLSTPHCATLRRMQSGSGGWRPTRRRTPRCRCWTCRRQPTRCATAARCWPWWTTRAGCSRWAGARGWGAQAMAAAAEGFAGRGPGGLLLTLRANDSASTAAVGMVCRTPAPSSSSSCNSSRSMQVRRPGSSSRRRRRQARRRRDVAAAACR